MRICNSVLVALPFFSHLVMVVSLVRSQDPAEPSCQHSRRAALCKLPNCHIPDMVYLIFVCSMTSVGATTGINPEVAATFSSGGFSNTFTRPSYQSSAVSSYLSKLGSTNSGRFNTGGRAFPDISAQGENVEIFVDGQSGTVAGTSCSSPIFASVIALLNDELIAAGKSPLGFLNPFLYVIFISPYQLFRS
jgi:subtilase family serine protease